jgi:hypothetical protein
VLSVVGSMTGDDSLVWLSMLSMIDYCCEW